MTPNLYGRVCVCVEVNVSFLSLRIRLLTKLLASAFAIRSPCSAGVFNVIPICFAIIALFTYSILHKEDKYDMLLIMSSLYNTICLQELLVSSSSSIYTFFTFLPIFSLDFKNNTISLLRNKNS